MMFRYDREIIYGGIETIFMHGGASKVNKIRRWRVARKNKREHQTRGKAILFRKEKKIAPRKKNNSLMVKGKKGPRIKKKGKLGDGVIMI